MSQQSRGFMHQMDKNYSPKQSKLNEMRNSWVAVTQIHVAWPKNARGQFNNWKLNRKCCALQVKDSLHGECHFRNSLILFRRKAGTLLKVSHPKWTAQTWVDIAVNLSQLSPAIVFERIHSNSIRGLVDTWWSCMSSAAHSTSYVLIINSTHLKCIHTLVIALSILVNLL